MAVMRPGRVLEVKGSHFLLRFLSSGKKTVGPEQQLYKVSFQSWSRLSNQRRARCCSAIQKLNRKTYEMCLIQSGTARKHVCFQSQVQQICRGRIGPAEGPVSSELKNQQPSYRTPLKAAKSRTDTGGRRTLAELELEPKEI